jgi:hypothetical protein
MVKTVKGGEIMQEMEVIKCFEKLNNLKECKHCIINPKATEPYVERKNLKLTNLTVELLEQMVKGTDLRKECAICLTIRWFCGHSKENQLKVLRSAVTKKA